MLLTRNFTLLILMSLAFNALSQHKMYFGYDASGNRVERSITLGNLRKSFDSSAVTADLNGFNIKVHPNPSRGKIFIEIFNFPKDSLCSYTIVNTQGIITENKKFNNALAEADLSNQPTGMYIMNVLIGRKKQEWKIIKE